MDTACCEGRKTRRKANATVPTSDSPLRPYFATAIHHRISIEYGFLSGKLRAYPYRLRAFIRFSGPRHVTVLPDISFLPVHARRIFLYAKSQLNSVATTVKLDDMKLLNGPFLPFASLSVRKIANAKM